MADPVGIGIDNIMGRRANPGKPFSLDLRGSTGDATPAELTSVTGEVLEATSTQGQSAGITLFDVDVVAQRSQTSDNQHVCWKAQFVYKYGSIVAASVTKNRVSETDFGNEADWDIDFDHYTASGTHRIRVLAIGDPGLLLHWRATVRATSVKSIVGA